MGNIYDDFLRRMNQYRLKLKLTQSETSDLLGTTQSQFSKMELGKTIIPYEILERMLEIGWDIDYLIIEKKKPDWENNITDFLDIEPQYMWEKAGAVLLWVMREMLNQSDAFADEDINCEFELLKLVTFQETSNSLLLELRTIMGISQIMMAEQLGVNIKKYRDLEKGNKNLDAELLAVIYELTSCRPQLFFHHGSLKMYLLNDLWNRLNAERQQKIILLLKQAIDLCK